MSSMGDLLEAVHGAPRATSFHASGHWSEDHGRMRAVVERINQSGGARLGVMRTGSEEGASVPSGLQETRFELWSGPGGWRVDDGPSRIIAAGGKVLWAQPEMGGVFSEIGEQRAPFGRFGMYLELPGEGHPTG